MNDTFQSDLKDVKNFHKMGEHLFNTAEVTYDIFAESVSDNRNQYKPEFKYLFRKTIPIMLCSAWENFVNELKKDTVRYAKHFPNEGKWYNDSINDISELRHAIAHDSGIMNQARLDKMKITSNKTRYPIGQIKLEPIDMDEYINIFDIAYKTIMS